jgi:hypothetical protein
MARARRYYEARPFGSVSTWNGMGDLTVGVSSALGSGPVVRALLLEGVDYEPGDAITVTALWAPASTGGASTGNIAFFAGSRQARPLAVSDTTTLSGTEGYDYAYGIAVPFGKATSTIYETQVHALRAFPRATEIAVQRRGNVTVDTHSIESSFVGLIVEASAPPTAPTVEELTAAKNMIAWWDPSDLGNITADGSNNVTQLVDLTGNLWHLTNPAASVGPVTGARTINGLNALDYSAHRLSVPLTAFWPFGLSIVVQCDTPTGGNEYILGSFLGYGTSGRPFASFGTSMTSPSVALDTNPHVLTVLHDQDYSQLRIDGVPVASGPLGSSGLSSIVTGSFSSASSSSPFDGAQGEKVVWKGAYHPDAIEAYLMAKWL